jgi:hypothetical protein
VFAAIERHREAWEAYGKAIDRLNDLQEAAIHKGVRPWSDYPGLEEADAAHTAASRADSTALWDLANTPPTTLAGAAALARYLADHSREMDGCGEGDIEAALTTLADALPALGKKAAHA